jgi:hypothetical protein
VQTYLTPTVENIELAAYLLKTQGTPQVSCDPGGCGDLVGSDCEEEDGTSDELQAQFFLAGTTSSSTPNCTVLVNGVQAANCTILNDGECEAGATWFIECEANVDCTGSDTVVISCDGFLPDTCPQVET